MDEILIEEKKYVSSKRAAKITGYAKDYVGQLCREGRVPARLVGRSWYVLESAIQDHRFGKEMIETKISAPATGENTWESPRYEAAPVEVLPTLVSSESEPQIVHNEAPETLQDSWKAWFDHVATPIRTETAPLEEVVTLETKEEAEVQEIEENTAPDEIKTITATLDDEVEIPIRTFYDLPPEDLLPGYMPTQITPIVSTEQEKLSQKTTGRSILMGLQLCGGILALAAIILAVISSGYFDRHITSQSLSPITGINFYNAK